MSSKSKFKCIDGPLRGATIWLSADASTFVFRIKGQVGRYVNGGASGLVRWEPAK